MQEERRALAIAAALGLLPRAVFAGAAPEGDAPPRLGTRVDGYRNYTRQALANCSRSVQVRYRESVSIADVEMLRACIATGQRESRSRLEAVLRSLRGNAAREALRAYQSSFESALAGVEPTPSETAAAYDQRQISLRHLLAHAWTRYELEER